LGGVETGSMKPNEQPTVAASAGFTGSTPAAWASASTTGTTSEALAVLLVISLTSTAIRDAASTMP
jgi:hypothetical protein